MPEGCCQGVCATKCPWSLLRRLKRSVEKTRHSRKSHCESKGRESLDKWLRGKDNRRRFERGVQWKRLFLLMTMPTFGA